jgi:transcriptional regulator with XRE-family HTH domain
MAASRLGLWPSEVSKLENGGGISLSRAKAMEGFIGIPLEAWIEPAIEAGGGHRNGGCPDA